MLLKINKIFTLRNSPVLRHVVVTDTLVPYDSKSLQVQ